MVNRPNSTPIFSTNSLLHYFQVQSLLGAVPPLSLTSPVLSHVEIQFDTAKRDQLLPVLQPLLESLTLHLSKESCGGGLLRIYSSPDSFLFLLHIDSSELLLQTIASHDSAAPELLKKARALLDVILVDKDDSITLSASYTDPQGYISLFTSSIRCPAWDEIAANYHDSTISALAPFMTIPDAASLSGRLLIWHGPAGTGKTYALRSLLRYWSPAYKPIFVSDPDEFLTKHHYYYSLVDRNANNRLLIVLEDSIRPLLTEARSDKGSPVGRLLNLTDGLLTKARDDVILLTFNESITDLDPAVIRPGRCLGLVPFHPLDPDQARVWLAAHDVNVDALPEPTTLAALYGLLNHQSILTPAVSRTGFTCETNK